MNSTNTSFRDGRAARFFLFPYPLAGALHAERPRATRGELVSGTLVDTQLADLWEET